MSETDKIYTLSKERAIELVRTYGPEALSRLISGNWSGLVQTCSQIYTDNITRKTLQEQRETFRTIKNAVLEFLQHIESKEIRIVQGAFNSSAAFTTTFQSATLLAIPLVLLKLNDSIHRVGSALEAIRSELAIANIAKVQGWEKDGFGSHIYRYVRTEMAAVNCQQQRHYFYVWNPDTDWYPSFEKKQRERPLGPNFGGYHTDLDTICLRMSSDRATLIRTRSYGHDAVFHLLIPAYGPIVISHPITFHSALFPLIITGQRHRSVDFVWFDLPSIPPGLDLCCVGVLDNEAPFPVKYGIVGFVSCWFGAASCAVAATVFPPCAPAAMSLGVGFCQAGVGSWALAAGGGIYDAMTTESIRVLGEPVFIYPEAEEKVSFLRKIAMLILWVRQGCCL